MTLSVVFAQCAISLTIRASELKSPARHLPAPMKKGTGASIAQVLIHQARKLYANDDFALELNKTVYALDSTNNRSVPVFVPRARFRKTKGAVKMHTLLDLRGNIPSFVAITDIEVERGRARVGPSQPLVIL